MTTYKITTDLNNKFKDRFEVQLNNREDIEDVVTNADQAIEYAVRYVNERYLQFNTESIVTAHNGSDVDILAVIKVNSRTRKISVRNLTKAVN